MKSIQYLGVLAIALILVACGGGSSNDSFGGGGNGSLSVSPTSATVTVNPQNFAPDPNSVYTTSVSVQFRTANGQAVADGTSVTLSTSNASRGVVSPIDQPALTGSTATSPTAGGRAQFWFTSGEQTGTVTLTASAANPSGGAGLTATAQINVEPGAGGDDRLAITGSSTMPTNEQAVPIFFGSPFINELNIRFTGPNGEAGIPADGQVGVAIAPVTTAAFSTLDDPETEDINEFFVLLGNGPVNMAAGVATVFVHSTDIPGDVTLTVSAVDANSGEQFTRDFVISIEDGAANFLPAQIDFSTNDQAVYIQGSGGPATKGFQLFVDDAGDNPVPDPQSSGTSWNNVRLQLEQPSGAGARLTGTGASGPVTPGSDILVRTVNGVAAFSLETGTEIGPHRITATVDRADNNMDNALIDPLSAEFTVEVGDGQLFALEIDNPLLNAIRIGRTSTRVLADDELVLNDNGIPIPPDPDGTYSLNLTVQGSDRVGNPVLPGTQVAFGNIDAPLTLDNPPSFVFSGPFADPEEAGDLLTVVDPEEGFLDDPARVDDGVEPGDTLVMFGKLIPGNREHEAARFVETIIDDQTVTVTQDFNPNDGTGQIVDDGAVIPWAIGRSQFGVIDQLVTLGDQGRGTVRLSYPVGAIGSPLILWAQGSRPVPAGTKSVADVEAFSFPGIAPLVLTATPNQVSGNQTVNVTLCLRDGIGSPISGVFVNAAVGGGTGSASLDGVPLGVGDDQTANATGESGCVVTALTTQGVIPSGEQASEEDGLEIVFFVGSASDTVRAVPSGSASLSVAPSRLVDQFQGPISTRVTLTLRDAEGNPISSVPLTGECADAGDGVVDILSGPGITDENGETSALILVNLFDCDAPVVGEFQCTFTTSSGAPVGTFTAVGLSPDDLPIVSPPCD